MKFAFKDFQLYNLFLIVNSIGRDNLFPDFEAERKKCITSDEELECSKKEEEYKKIIVADRWKALTLWRVIIKNIKIINEEYFNKLERIEEIRRVYTDNYEKDKAALAELNKDKKDNKRQSLEEQKLEREFMGAFESEIKKKEGVKILGQVGQGTLLFEYLDPKDAKDVKFELEEKPINALGFLREQFERNIWKMNHLPSDVIASVSDVIMS